MKKAFLAALFILFIGSAVGQYYLRGEIKNERGTLLEGVLIQLSFKGLNPFYSVNGGAFGIDTRKMQSFLVQMLPSTATQFKKSATQSQKI